MKKYLITMKNIFLVYQPGSDIIYRGKKKAADLKDILMITSLTTITTPVLNFIAKYAWPLLDLSGYRMIKYTILMIVWGGIL